MYGTAPKLMASPILVAVDRKLDTVNGNLKIICKEVMLILMF